MGHFQWTECNTILCGFLMLIGANIKSSIFLYHKYKTYMPNENLMSEGHMKSQNQTRKDLN